VGVACILLKEARVWEMDREYRSNHQAHERKNPGSPRQCRRCRSIEKRKDRDAVDGDGGANDLKEEPCRKALQEAEIESECLRSDHSEAE